jgi:hypothetical protein
VIRGHGLARDIGWKNLISPTLPISHTRLVVSAIGSLRQLLEYSTLPVNHGAFRLDLMTPAGYMAKIVKPPVGFHIDNVFDVYSVSSHISDDFADYIQYWKHNGYWLFDSPQIIWAVAHENSIQLEGTSLFYYEVHEMEFDGASWRSYHPELSFPTSVIPPSEKVLEGFDVVTFFARSSPECSPLSCNAMAKEISTNEHCLLASFDDAYEKVTGGAFNQAEPGPYRIFAVYSLDWPSES